ncbi:hypothetical protein [Brevundimonas diminuta]|uniref:hypothetical protein n=1 Tax=Brevundimonas diminuta TaxID=293 RepID=UPI003D9A5501
MPDPKLPAAYAALDWQERRRVREAYVQHQSGACHHCEAPLSGLPPQSIRDKWINWRLFPKNFLRHPVHLHHSHETGLTIGAVHALCNAVLWQYHGE